MILRDIVKTNADEMQVCCFIDDNPNKVDRSIDNVPVVGGSDDILLYAKKTISIRSCWRFHRPQLRRSGIS